jgi:hypothetical protein
VRRAAKGEEENTGTDDRDHLKSDRGSPDGENPRRCSLADHQKEDVRWDRYRHTRIHE